MLTRLSSQWFKRDCRGFQEVSLFVQKTKDNAGDSEW